MPRRLVGILWLVGLSALLGMPAPVAAGDGLVEGLADFEYTLGSHLEGTVSGHCGATGVSTTPGQPGDWFLSAESARLLVYETWINYTWIAPETGHPVYHQLDVRQEIHETEVPGEDFRIIWSTSGVAAILGPSAYAGGRETFRVDFDANQLSTAPAARSHRVDWAWLPDADGPLDSAIALPGPARSLSIQAGEAVATGDMSLHLEEAEISTPRYRYQLPPAVESWTRETPGAQVVTERLHHGLLKLEGAKIDLPAASQPFCQTSSMTVDGELTAYGARGTVEAFDQTMAFEQRELEVVGTFDLEEQSLDGDVGEFPPVRAQAAGHFTAVGLDFVPVDGSESSWAREAEPLVVLAAAGGAAWGLWKLLVGLFTRLNRDELLDLEGRRRVFELVQSNPGATLNELVTLGTVNPHNARYHLRVLSRHGRVRSLKLRREWRFFAADHDVRSAQTDLWLKVDPKLAQLRSLLGPNGMTAKSLVETLQRDWNLSRSGAWKVIKRAEAARVAIVERSGREVVLRCAS